MTGDLRTRVEALRPTTVTVGGRAYQVVSYDELRAVLDADPDTPTACICDGGAYEVKDHPFLVHPDCPVHRPDTPTADAPADTELRVDMREAIYYCLTDASMWIGDDGRPLDYLPAREALMGEFLDEAVDALLPLVRTQVEAARRDALNEAADDVPHYIGSQRKTVQAYLRQRAARGETR